MDNLLKISFIQSDISWLNIDKNLDVFGNKIVGLNSDIVFLPEMFDTGFVTDKNIIKNIKTEKTFAWLKNTAKINRINIGGSFIAKTETGLKNRFVFMRTNGDFGFYDKRHLFSLADENIAISRGNERKTIVCKGWKINLQICYDLRFPVWARNTDNYDLLVYVANWPASRIEQWETLLKARAIENQAYVVGVNRIGTDGNGFIYSGNSLVIDFKGQILHKSPENQEDIPTLTLSFDKLKIARQKFPFLKDRDEFVLR